MEMLVDKIFDRVEQNPASVGDIRKLMEYYLPTTIKLLQAYQDLDAQPVQGENIISSKKEIEKTLDTLNRAFEKLLDDLFQETAWDVSTDISVLHTMLAQEGLTEDGLKK
jgi:5-bromo-4-chloroindolyl phosphate hydrolysis protein.